MRANLSARDPRASRVTEALRIAAERRAELSRLKAEGQAAAGAEALCDGTLRHAIRLSLEYSQARNGAKTRPISRRQMDKLIRIISRRRFAKNETR